jgi:hypothetical protein
VLEVGHSLRQLDDVLSLLFDERSQTLDVVSEDRRRRPEPNHEKQADHPGSISVHLSSPLQTLLVARPVARTGTPGNWPL